MVSLGIFSIVIASACSSQTEVEDQSHTLPPPSVRTVQPKETVTIAPTEDLVVESDPVSESVPPNETGGSSYAFGTESHRMDFQTHGELFEESGVQLIRHNALIWQKVEPEEGDRQWDAVGELEGMLAGASANGLSTILIVRGTPSWAQKVPGSGCGPITPEKMESFASFMMDAVNRYGGPPYNVKYWELGNEPDVDPSLVRPNSVFGCWGDNNDPYYGGGYYAEMLKVVYPAIKAADPEAKVLIGGLLLDCDPTNPPEGQICLPGNFLEGILNNGGGDYFDIVSFHGYIPYTGPAFGGGGLYYDQHLPKWEHRGGGVAGKIDYIQELLAKYNLDKPIIHTEGSLICPEWNSSQCNPPVDAFYEAQADYVVRLYVQNWADDLFGTIWYQFEGPGWRFGGLLDEDQNPRPSFEALSFLTVELSEAGYSGEVTQYESLVGHKFLKPDKQIWVVWSPDEVETQIQLPENLLVVFNKYGEDITPPGKDITVSCPIYLELIP
jgi:hypothetical protein